MPAAPLLPTVRARSWSPNDLPHGWSAAARYQSSPGSADVEIVVADAPTRPLAKDLRSVWKRRLANRGIDLLLVVRYPTSDKTGVAVVGVATDHVRDDVPLASVVAACTEALLAPTPTAVRAAVEPLFADVGDEHLGLYNEGLFATYALETFRGRHADTWRDAANRSESLRGLSGADLVQGLGWAVQPHGENYLLQEGDHTRAVAVLLQGDEVFDRPSLRFGLGASPVEKALELADRREVAWVVAVQGQRIRLYAVSPEVGIRRTGATSYTELDIAHLPDEDLAYAALLFSPVSLRPRGTVWQVLSDSRERATSLGARLRERVYINVVPDLATTIARRATPPGEALAEPALHDAYHRTLVILFRALFVAYAEDRGLLPYSGDTVAGYNRVALKNRAKEWTTRRPTFDPAATDLWTDLTNIWRAVFHGSPEWGVPQYGGTLFDDGTPAGTTIAGLALTNAEIGPALEALLVDEHRGERGPVDFGTLSVREFGTIYEGLLESSLSTAPADLALGRDDVYVTAKPGDEVVVRGGDVYFHNASGARKATGSYFTKEFAVEHLLSTSLDPTLDEHLDRVSRLLDAGRTADASDALFDFRVADISMGSGHFLVGAVDHVAAKLGRFFTEHETDLSPVRAELGKLRESAEKALAAVGRAPDEVTLLDEALIRRQVARRCIYGVDVNEIAVDLARLALWIHTFVPGLPMSNLDHGLVHGNSLTGIGSVDEALEALDDRKARGGMIQGSVFATPVEEAMEASSEDYARAAVLYESTPSEAEAAARLRDEAEEKMRPTRLAFDAAIAGRLGVVDLPSITPSGWDAVVAAGNRPAVRALIEELQPVHFPVAFPEAFRSDRERPGFDVMIGNPPWDEVMVEEPKFWQRYHPGVMGLKPDAQKKEVKRLRKEHPDLVPVLDREREDMARLRQVLLAGRYPQLGEGDVDYYKAFSWRAWALLRDAGRLGVVFPRSLLNAAGSATWRETVLTKGSFELVVALTNTGRWVFDDVHGQYSVVLITAAKRTAPDDRVHLSGPFHSRADFDRGALRPGTIDGGALIAWGNGAAFPLLPDTRAAEIFEKYRRHPRFDAPGEWQFRPVAEFHATNDRKTFDAGAQNPERWPVYTGATFNLWDPDFGDPYAWADPETVVQALLAKRKNQARLKRSAFYGLPQDVLADRRTLPCLSPRILFRDVARATDSRTMIACLAPGQAVATNKAPYLFRAAGTPADDAYMLGVLSSVPFDWYARRYVELAMSIGILNAFPVPRPATDSPFRARLVEVSGRLAAVDDRFAEWAAVVGVPVGSVTDDATQDDLTAELDALVALLYGLDRDDVVHIFETFHRGWDFQARLDAALGHYDRWSARS